MRSDEWGGKEVDCTDKKTRTPHLGCGEWYAMMICYDDMLWWHSMMLCYDDMLWWYAMMICCYDVLWWHAMMTFYDDMLWWYAMMICYDDMLWWYTMMICYEEMRWGVSQVDCADKKTRTPHLGCGEKQKCSRLLNSRVFKFERIAFVAIVDVATGLYLLSVSSSSSWAYCLLNGNKSF